MPVFDHDERWFPGSLATCDNALLCDFCGPRRAALSAERFRWHFEDWLAGGGQLVHIRLSVPHTSTDSLADLLATLKAAESGLRSSAAWKRAGLVDWVRVLHVRWSKRAGWHPHYHVVGFIPAGVQVDVEALEVSLSGVWRQRVAGAGIRRTAGRRGVFARVVTSALRAMYAWGWAGDDDDDDEDDDDRYHPMADRDDGEGARRSPSMSLARVAQLALDGDRHAWAAWAEVCRALKGVPVVRASRMLDRLWAAREADAGPGAPAEGEAEAVELGEPVVLVDARLWERARREGVTQLGLSVGRELGADAMARWWAQVLGVRVRVSAGVGPPRLMLVPDRARMEWSAR